MKVCIFGAASAHIGEKYIAEVEKLGKELALRGHSLVFGSGATGLMGASARGFKAGGGFIHGVIPDFFLKERIEAIYTDCDKTTVTQTMAERKKVMEDDAEAFIITPGGVGTLEEFFEVLTLKQLGRHRKAIAIYDIDGYFDELEKFMDGALEKKFINSHCRQLYKCVYSTKEAIEYIENYKPTDWSVDKLKLGE